MFPVVAICIIVALISWMIWKRLKFCQIIAKIPGPTALPIVGNVLQFKRASHELLCQMIGWSQKYCQGLFCTWLGPNPFIQVYKPEYVEALLSSQKNIVKSWDYSFLHPWLGTGLLTSAGAKWKSRRRLLTSTFHFKILNNYIPIYQKQSDILVERLKAHAGKAEFDISPYITLCTLDIICETAMGVHISAQSNNDSKYVQTVLRMSALILARIKKPWTWNDTIYSLTSSGKRYRNALNILHGFTNKVISDRITKRKQLKETDCLDELPVSSAKKRGILAFLDLLLEEYDQGNITKEGIREEVDTFMFEGHDTTSASLLWTLHLIGKHPDVQSKLQKEVDNLYESGDEFVSSEQLRQLHYLECVIKESLRLFPSVAFFTRRITKGYQIGPYWIPEGCSVVLNTMALHRNPDVWPDPNTFDPDRFLLENCVGRHPFAYVPFSAGPRNCIGQKFAMLEEKVVLSSIIRNFNIHSSQTTEDIKKSSELILRSIEGIWVKLESRHKD